MSDTSADFTEARWRRLSDEMAAGMSLSAADQAFVEDYVPASADGLAEAQFFEALGQLGEDEPDDEEPANSPLVHATLQHVLADRERGVSSMAEPRRTRGLWMAAGGMLAVAAMGVLWASFTPSAPEPQGDGIASVDATRSSPQVPTYPQPETNADRVVAPESNEAVAPTEAAPTLSVSSGQLADAAGVALAVGAAPQGVLHIESDQGCLALGRVTACFGSGAKVQVSESPHRLEVLEGQGVIEAPEFTTRALVMEIAGERYEVTNPVEVKLVAYSRSTARVEVLEGSMALVGPEGEREVLGAGTVRGKSRPARAAAVPDTKTLLAKARASRKAGDRRAAISHYEKLLRFHPDSPVSKAAMISLGDLYLDVGKPSAALEWFQRYLAKGGALAQEAHVGRIKALGALGRSGAKQRAIEEFRKRYPSSRYADQVSGGTTG